ncbi:helix-turn-helix domain-containing protein [Arthrobacter russicus]|uniref:helix-turn-helix domain-containing protein n=1 Tax=Arthrobacter russicus TaxID=172040 RepID=UPI003CEE4506
MSAAQTWRLVTQRPERISLPVLAALCDVFHCSPAELITVTAHDAIVPKAVNKVVDLNATASRARPRRARVIRDER